MTNHELTLTETIGMRDSSQGRQVFLTETLREMLVNIKATTDDVIFLSDLLQTAKVEAMIRQALYEQNLEAKK